MRKKYICILVAVIGVCSLSGCGSSARKTEEEQVTIGVVTKSKSSEYWLSVCDGMKDAAEKYHADVVILSPDSETEEEVQKNMIRDLLKTDIQAMAVSPIDSYECEDYLNFAREKGISVYACDTPIEDSEIPSGNLHLLTVDQEIWKKKYRICRRICCTWRPDSVFPESIQLRLHGYELCHTCHRTCSTERSCIQYGW